MNIELNILDWIQTLHTPFLDKIMVFITRLGDVGIIWIVLSIVLLLIPKTRKSGAVMVAALVVDVLLFNIVLKNDGYTGRNFNRPGFQAMLAEAEAGKIGTIIVKDMSRFCRNYLEVGFYTEILFPKKQIRFVAINNSVDSDKPQDNDFTPFLNIMNEWYAKDTSNKISRARQKRRSNTALFCYPEVTNSGF